MRAPVLLILLLWGAAVFAGCLGGEDAPLSQDEGDGSAGPAEVTETTGAVEGEVLDARDLSPLHGAMVGVLLAGQVVDQTSADRQGRYTLSGLEPGTYTVTMNAMGYASMGRASQVKAGEVAKVSALLEPLSTTDLFFELLDFDGFMSFGASTPVVATTSGLEDPNHAVRFDFEVDPVHLDSILIEVYWSNPTAGLRGNLWLNPNCNPVCNPDHAYGVGSGFGSFALRADHEGGTWPALGDEPTVLSLRMWSHPGDDPATVAFQQHFKVFIGTYFVEPAPEGVVPSPHG